HAGALAVGDGIFNVAAQVLQPAVFQSGGNDKLGGVVQAVNCEVRGIDRERLHVSGLGQRHLFDGHGRLVVEVSQRRGREAQSHGEEEKPTRNASWHRWVLQKRGSQV